MAGPMLASVLNQVRSLQAAQASDRELLQQFVVARDESAFAVIVERYGPMVMRVCRNRLVDGHAAEDAFQATFLILAKKAAAVRPEQLGCWLHGVAYKVARRARRPAPDRISSQDTIAVSSADPAAEITLREALAVLDEELARLPDKQRIPLVMCYLEEKTRDEAVQQLGWPEGTFKRRLECGRDMLRRRLTQRGLTLSAGLLATLLTSEAPAAIPASLKRLTLQHALVLAGSKSLATIAGDPVRQLVEAVLPTLAPSRLHLAVLLGLMLVAGSIGAGWLVAGESSAMEAESPKQLLAQLAPPDRLPAPRVDNHGDALPDRAFARMGTTRVRHGDDVFFVGFADQGKVLVTGALDGTLAVWDAQQGKELHRLGKIPVYQDVGRARVTRGSDTIVYTPPAARATAALSPDGSVLAVADVAGSIRLWNVVTGKETHTFKVSDAKEAYAVSLAFAPDGRALIAKGGDHVFKEWDPATGKELRSYHRGLAPRENYLFGAAESLAVSPDGKLVAAGTVVNENNEVKNVLRLWDRAAGKELRILGEDLQFGVASIAFSPDGKLLVWAGRNWTVHRWDVAAERALPPIRHQAYNQPVALAFAPDGRTLAIKQTDDVVTLWDVQQAKERGRLGRAVGGPHPVRNVMETHLVTPGAVAFAPDGKSLAVAGADHMVSVWDIDKGADLLPVGGHQGAVTRVVLAPDGKTLTSWGTDQVVRRWETATGKEVGALMLRNADGPAALSSNGQRVAYGAADGSVRVWDIVGEREIFTVSGPLASTTLLGMGVGRGLALSPDGNRLALLGWDQTVRVWDIAAAKEQPRLRDPALGDQPPVLIAPGPRSDPIEIAFSPDGAMLATVGAVPDTNDRQGRKVNASVALWNLTTSKLIRRFDDTASPVAVAFVADGYTLATASADGSVRLHEVLTGREQAQFKTNPFRGGVAVALSPDGRVLAAGGFRAPQVRLWDVSTGKELGQVGDHRGAVRTLTFTPDGKALIAGSADTALISWDVAALTALPAPTALTEAATATLWDDLAGADAGKALRAMIALRGSPQQALTVAARLKPAAAVEPKLLTQWIADLGSDEFAKRRAAEEELARRAELAVSELEKVLATKPSLEVRQRIERLLEQAQAGGVPAPETAQAVRAVQVLEQIGTAEAKEILRRLAGGVPGARLTRAAMAAADRLDKR